MPGGRTGGGGGGGGLWTRSKNLEMNIVNQFAIASNPDAVFHFW